jgi:hypothetical protein
MSQRDICELIVRPTSSQVFAHDSLAEAEAALKELSASIRLDLHGVLNCIEPEQPLTTHDKEICVISFVGVNSDTRALARKEIQQRIETGQVKFGLLVFNRGSQKKQDRNSYFKPGSKAWANSLIKLPGDLIGRFIDDSEDHILSVKALCPHLDCIHFTLNSRDGLLGMLFWL